MLKQRMMWIAWPAFIVAGIMEMVVFAMVDPEDMRWFGHPLALSRQGVYTVGFFVFWALSMLSSSLTTLLSMSPFEAKRCTMDPFERPDGCTKQPKMNQHSLKQ
jgi:hypothetical protein